jgi:predicted DsbA family dithiol-disulfide isomerase
MHDKLFEIKPRARPDVMSLAATLALDATTFTKCLDEAPNALPRIERDIQKAQEFKLTGTPAFGIGTVRSDGQVVIRNFISGAQRFDVFEKSLNDAIASGGAK